MVSTNKLSFFSLCNFPWGKFKHCSNSLLPGVEHARNETVHLDWFYQLTWWNCQLIFIIELKLICQPVSYKLKLFTVKRSKLSFLHVIQVLISKHIQFICYFLIRGMYTFLIFPPGDCTLMMVEVRTVVQTYVFVEFTGQWVVIITS